VVQAGVVDLGDVACVFGPKECVLLVNVVALGRHCNALVTVMVVPEAKQSVNIVVDVR
jgi:hypothetical protein